MEPLQVRIWSNKKKLATQKKTNITKIKEDQELNDVEIQTQETTKPLKPLKKPSWWKASKEFKSSTSSADARAVVDAFLGRAKTLLNVNRAEPCEATNVQRA